MFERNLSDRERARFELESVSRRRLIKDICAATGWVFLTQASLSYAADPKVEGDSTNGDKSWGTIKGRVVFDGKLPPVKEIELEKLNLAPDDLTWFKSMGPVLNQEWVIDPKSRSIQWVYVWLLPEDKTGELKVNQSLLELPKEKKLVIVDQEPIGYVPHAVGVQPGQGILMRNRGPIAHVFNLTGFKNDPFNKAMPPGSEIAIENLKPEAIPIQITCPPHPWERMWLRSFDNPYFAVTDADGNFEIKLAPTGKCRLVVWHETAGFAGGRSGKNGSVISVEGAAVTDLGDIKLTAKA
jgi:hypothetical protein